jgi:LPS sulfotransferase NodH
MPALARNEHLLRIEEYFGPMAREPADLPGGVSYVFLCFTNRCGSNYLAELIASNGCYNRAGEILNWPSVLEIARRAGLKRFQDFFAHIALNQQKSGRFFVKTALLHLEMLARSGILDQVADRARFILLERDDTLAQAISHALAFSTGAFSSLAAPVEEPHAVEYSRAAIERYVNTIGQARRQFALFFGRNGIVPVRMIYERLHADPEGEVAWLARELGLPEFAIDRSKLRLERQHGPANEEWRRRYLSERE